jgi:hypothetical protein
MDVSVDALGAAHEHEPGVLAAPALRKALSVETGDLVRLLVLGTVDDAIDTGMLHAFAGPE